MFTQRCSVFFSKLNKFSIVNVKFRNFASDKVSEFKQKILKGPHLSEFLAVNDNLTGSFVPESDPPPYVYHNSYKDRKGYLNN